MDGLVRQLRAQLVQVCDRYPAGLITNVLTWLDEIEAQLTPELADSQNDHAHQASDMLTCVLDDLQAAYRAFREANANTGEYEGTR